MQTLSFQAHPADWQALKNDARKRDITQSKLLCALANHALLWRCGPRSMGIVKGKDLINVGISVSGKEKKRWEDHCIMKLRFWLRETVLPLIHSQEGIITQALIVLDERELEKIEIGLDGPWIKLKVTPQWKEAADGQWDAVKVWAKKVLDQAAPYFIANPRIS